MKQAALLVAPILFRLAPYLPGQSLLVAMMLPSRASLGCMMPRLSFR